MRFGDADVEVAIGETFSELREPRAVRHSGGNADDARILFGQRNERVGKDVLELRRRARVGFLAAVVGLVRVGTHAVERARVALGRLEALAFDGAHVYEHRAVEFFGGLEDIDDGVEVVSVDRPHITEAELLEDDRGFFRRSDEMHRADLGGFDGFLGCAAEGDAIEYGFAGAAGEVGERLGAQNRKI